MEKLIFMEITTDTLPWEETDVANWKAFLGTKTGQRLIPKLAESVPDLLAGGNTNEILIRNGEVRSFRNTIRDLLSLAAPQPVQQPPNESDSNYPPPELDEHWDDGQKITTLK